ncbi:MAG TPA: shikimate dehydrogenase [Steroidobacteraceae bacterium]|nr:shikimate dehydrogenase [Steroidobacteraceae bacterium]
MSASPEQFGVVGHPVGHSLSPFIHGLFARETGRAITYRLFDVPPAEFRGWVRDFFARGGRGLNVTVPHKIAAVDVADDLSNRAAHAAAVNTLTRTAGEQILGDNTDGTGLVRDLCDNLGLMLTKRRVLIVGAGGATRGLLAPLLALAPAAVVIANRTPERAAALAAAFADLGSVSGVRFEDVGPEPFDLIINATSASLSGEIPPLPASALSPATVCYDLAYGRSATAFVQWARACGCHQALQGWGMLVEQAAESFLVWHGIRPPTAAVLAALRERGATP